MNIFQWKERNRECFAIGNAQPARERTPADVTVVIPSFNHEAFIEETLQSVLAQTYSRLRILVVDDASSDATAERAMSVRDARITVKVNPRNIGLGNSILSVLPDIKTPLVALLNSDDLFHAERLSRCCRVLLDSPETQMVATDVSLIDTKGGCLRADNISLFRDGRKIYYWVRWFEETRAARKEQIPSFVSLLKYNFLVSSSNIVCKTDYLRDQSEAIKDLNYCLDWQLFLDASMHGSLAYLQEQLLGYRLHSQNTVWFDDETKTKYLLEANKVAARSLRRYIACLLNSGIDRQELEKSFFSALLNLGENPNVHCFRLFLSDLCESTELGIAERPAEWHGDLLEIFNRVAQRTRFAKR